MAAETHACMHSAAGLLAGPPKRDSVAPKRPGQAGWLAAAKQAIGGHRKTRRPDSRRAGLGWHYWVGMSRKDCGHVRALPLYVCLGSSTTEGFLGLSGAPKMRSRAIDLNHSPRRRGSAERAALSTASQQRRRPPPTFVWQPHAPYWDGERFVSSTARYMYCEWLKLLGPYRTASVDVRSLCSTAPARAAFPVPRHHPTPWASLPTILGPPRIPSTHHLLSELRQSRVAVSSNPVFLPCRAASVPLLG